jgi:hypothetical protein
MRGFSLLPHLIVIKTSGCRGSSFKGIYWDKNRQKYLYKSDLPCILSLKLCKIDISFKSEMLIRSWFLSWDRVALLCEIRGLQHRLCSSHLLWNDAPHLCNEVSQHAVSTVPPTETNRKPEKWSRKWRKIVCYVKNE